MTRTPLLALLFVAPAVAAPLPDAERERLAFHRKYGTWTDPGGRCAVRLTGEELRIRLPGNECIEHEFAPRPPSDAPKLLQEVEGDFRVQVVVRCPRQQDNTLALERYITGGLWVEDGQGVRAFLRRSERAHRNLRLHFERGWWDAHGFRHGAPNNDESATPSTSLRLARYGEFLQFEYSWDGSTWHAYGTPERLTWLRRVKVGLFAENTTGIAAEVTFDQFTLTKPKK